MRNCDTLSCLSEENTKLQHALEKALKQVEELSTEKENLQALLQCQPGLTEDLKEMGGPVNQNSKEGKVCLYA